MWETAHFETGTFDRTGVQRRLPDEEYGRALDCLVKACTDILVVRAEDGAILLGKRCVQPQPDWWFVPGGRMQPGESATESCARIFRREAGVTVDPARTPFRLVGQYTFVWQYRAQSPQSNGTCDVSLVHAIVLPRTVCDTLSLTSDEYTAFAWRQPDSIVTDSTLHPALRRAVTDYARRKAYDELQALVEAREQRGEEEGEQADPATVWGLCKTLVRAPRSLPSAWYA